MLATDSCRRDFALDTIGRLHASASDAFRSELTPDERQMADNLAKHFADADPQAQLDTLTRLNDSMTEDDVRAIEFHYDITEWMCALESWFNFRLTNDPSHIASIAINMVNSIDQTLDDDPDGYSINNMLGDPKMVAEYERQQRLLVPPQSP